MSIRCLEDMCLSVGFIAISGICVFFLYSHVTAKQLLTTNNIEDGKEKIVFYTDGNDKFTYGQNNNYSILRGQYFEELCMLSNENLSQEMDKLSTITSPRYNNKELPSQYSLIKITNSLKQLKCAGFNWDEQKKELIYNKKPVRFLLDPTYITGKE